MKDYVIGVRVYPGISKNPVLKGSKLETFTKVYASIINSTENLNVKIVVFSDGCSGAFHKMIEEVTPKRNELEIIKLDCQNGKKSFNVQYEYLLKSKTKLVAFLEDDYLLESDALVSILEFAAERNFEDYYTFFNSSDYYHSELHRYKSLVAYSKGQYWRTVASTTLTFICTPEMLQKNRIFFKTYLLGNFDHNIWILQTKLGWWCILLTAIKSPSANNMKRLLKFLVTILILFPYVVLRRQKLWVCVPGKGTHLETRGFCLDYEI